MIRLLAFILILAAFLIDLTAVKAFEFPSSNLFNNFLFPSLAPFPTKTPKPTAPPAGGPAPTPAPTATPVPSTTLEILDIDPSSANFMEEFVLTGTNFGNQPGSVSFRASGQSYSSGGAPIISWADNEIHAKVPAVKKGTYYLQVATADSKKSNEIRFSVKNGQPIIISTSLNIQNGAYELTFQGTEFGIRKGSIDIYAGSNLAGNGIIKSWSSSRIRFTVPALPHQEYGFQITTTDGRKSSLRFFTVGN